MQRRLQPGFGARTMFAVLIAGTLHPMFAAAADTPAFQSAHQAIDALYKAVDSGDETAITRLLGPLASSGDLVQDKAELKQFVEKYSEMHRLVKQPDGTTILYIGAENWPFPVPLISSEGTWRFDAEAGARELIFRRVGEDETMAIQTSRTIARAIGHQNVGASHTAIDEYAKKVAASQNPTSESFHGYQFRVVRASAGAVLVAYPSEYGSTGVMTFAVTPDGTVYERDLGPETSKRAQAISGHKPDRKWHVAEQ